MSTPIAQRVMGFVWLESSAEEAAGVYAALFGGSRVVRTVRWGAGGPFPEGSVATVEIELGSVRWVLFNGGTHFKLNEAFSMVATCRDQAEIDRVWEVLVAGGKPLACGWLVDRFGVSWQVWPAVMSEYMGDPAKWMRAHAALMGMVKPDVAGLVKAAEG